MEERTWQGRAAFLFCLCVGAAALRFALAYAAGPLAVILIAWGVAAAIAPLAEKTAKVTGVPRKLCAACYVFAVFLLLGGLLAMGAIRLWREMEKLFGFLSENRVWLRWELDRFALVWKEKLSGLPMLGDASLGELWRQTAAGWLDGAMASLGTVLASGVGNAAKALPRLLALTVVTVLACFYLSMDYERIRAWVLSRLPARSRERVEVLCGRGARAIRSYLRAYLSLMGLTFFEILIGLSILRVPYSFLIALGVAAVDLLPVVGAGVILIPWAILSLMGGNSSLGVGLLILYGVVTIVRQIAEPRLLGGCLGLPPIVSLLSLFFGFWVFGFWGILLGPAAALLAKEYLTASP